KKDNIFLEIFISPQGIVNKYNHVCLSYSNRKDLISQAKEKKYKIRIIPREDFDLVFVYDKSGNIFEIKELVK
ncbi:MAG: hypothetical protein K9N07_09360, partial [Candidatus Cloacimonetes bacterium]|nr:hypothetical protein [Candidatus Cloacimonadota bacterium]